MPVKPLNITGPNIAGAMHVAETENVARRKLADTEKRTGILNTQVINKGKADLISNLNMASQIQERELKNSLSRTKAALSLMAGVGDQESFESAKSQFLTLSPGKLRGEAETQWDQLFGTKYNAKRVKTARTQLIAMSNQLQSILTPKTVGENQKLVSPTTGEVIATGKPKTYKPEGYEVFEGPDGDQIYVQKGNKVPKGYKKIFAKGVSTTVNVGLEDPLTKATRTQLQKDVIEATKNIGSFQETSKLFKPEYLTWLGKGDRALSETMDKAGFAPKRAKKYIREYNKWFRRAKADFIAYRKWATGVAGGPQELAEIATSFPDPVKNSPEQYKANLESIEATTKQVLMLNRDFLSTGVDLNQPLDKIFEQLKGQGKGGLIPPKSGATTPDELTPDQEAEQFFQNNPGLLTQ